MQKDPTQRFSGLAEIYAKARPTYPEEAIDFVLQATKLAAGAIIADVGCGTGISTRLFGDKAFQMIGVEPNDDMRTKAANESQDKTTISYIKGSAEHTGLNAASVDAVLAAQAFHWFSAQAALAEFHRILKPGGWVILMWNERHEANDLTRGYGHALRELPDTAGVEMKRGIAGAPLLDDTSWSNRQKRDFDHAQTMTLEGLICRAFSASYVPQEGPAAEALRKQLETVFRNCADNDSAEMLYKTTVYLGQQPL